MTDHKHYPGCHLHHFPCALERIRDLERELAQYRTPTSAGAIPPTWTVDAVPFRPFATHDTVIPCNDPYFTHHGDEPPSATP